MTGQLLKRGSMEVSLFVRRYRTFKGVCSVVNGAGMDGMDLRRNFPREENTVRLRKLGLGRGPICDPIFLMLC